MLSWDRRTVDSRRGPDHAGLELHARRDGVRRRVARPPLWSRHRAPVDLPRALTPLVMIFGLFVGFLAADVWPTFERARAAVDQEAMALREAVLLAEALPPEARANLRAAVRAHITYAVKEEWPAMAIGGETLRRLPRELMRGTMDLLA